MIILGYPGVGKSYACGKDRGIIDLESSFFHSEYANNTLVEPYVRVAIDLHQQGYTVCISSHWAIRNTLRNMLRIRLVWPDVNQSLKDEWIKRNVAMIYPDQSLKDAWIERLKNRYHESQKCQDVPWIIEKNYIAWQRAIDYYDIDIYDMSQCEEFTKYVIEDLDSYDVRVAIDFLIKNREELMNVQRSCDKT